MKKILVILFFLSSVVFPQKKDAQKIIDQVQGKFDKIKDYQADVEVKLDMDFVKVPPTKAKVYFKQPDKFKVESEGFAMIPKQSMDFSPMQLLKGDFTPLYVRAEKINDVEYDVVKLIPNTDTTAIILSTLWIEPKKMVIDKVETSTKSSGTVEVKFTYETKTLPLPSTLKFSFNMGGSNDQQNSKDEAKQNSGNENRFQRPIRIKGSVIMTYRNYIINKGIADSFFDEKSK